MPPVQIGIDIATSLSVIGAAVAFTYTQLSQSRRARAASIRAERVKQMSIICDDLAGILKMGANVVNNVRKAQAGRDVNISSDDYTDFCIMVKDYIEINTACKFKVWANDAEQSQLSEFTVTVGKWNAAYIKAASDRDAGKDVPVPSFDDLIEELTKKVQRFSALVREEIERTKA